MATTTPPGSEQAADPPWLDDAEQRAWLGAAALMLKLPGVLDGQLQRDSGLGLFEYLTLSTLSMSPDRRMRMSELAELTNGSLSRLSNVVKRLEQRQWVVRRPDPTDGRYTVAALTDTGWDTVVAAAPGHVRTVRHFVLDPLSAGQVRQLEQIGQRIRERTAIALPAPDPCGPPDPCVPSDPTC
ncbi:MarR family winged helix-turn-helix transcriptional regulator [Nakamurella deserti]|uniref:MarR family winged helix-turn-helix transcriptional regulator n=1 Tax=Nakamurella deserti TaxID=2164074 RepID=UPI000DBE9DC4|nr:MarR family transcriptional regulator [Nakamurella deserti]